MTDASKKILATKNAEALPPQGKALDLIIQLEKYIEHVIDLQTPQGQAPPPPPDPFEDKQQHELKKRIKGTAGQLELLAKKQTDLAKDISQSPADQDASPPDGNASATGKPDPQNQPGAQKEQSNPAPGADSPSGQNNPQPAPGTTPSGGKPGDQDNPGSQNPSGSQGSQNNPAPGADTDNSDKPASAPTPQSVDPFAPGADKGTFAERQARVLQGIETLLGTNDVLPPTVNQALQAAQKDAIESVHQLDQGNAAAAREPAASSSQDLQRAVTEMNNAGEKATQLAMEQAQQKLNSAAQQLKDLKNGSSGSQEKGLADVASKVQDIQKEAGDAADQQQETGSADGARHLANLANQIGNQHIAADLGAMAQKAFDVKQAGIDADKLEALAEQAAHGMAGDKPSTEQIAKLLSSLEASRANLAHLAEKAGATGAEMNGAQPPSSNQPGQGQNPQGGKDQGQNQGQQGQQSGKDQGQDQGQGQQPDKDQGQDPGQGSQPNGMTGPGGVPGTAPGGTLPGGMGSEGASGISDPEAKAFNETLQDVKDEAQQAASIVPQKDAHDLESAVGAVPDPKPEMMEYHMVNAYRVIASPFDKLIQDLTILINQTKRQDLLKQPDLDEAPPAYRPAVSDYFENMSKYYHPDNADDTKKP